MPVPSVAYAFDPTGQLAANIIRNEQHTITAVNWRDYHFIVPKFAPFFSDSLKIKHIDTQGIPRYLIKGVDWYESHKFVDASVQTAKPIYGSISFLNKNLSGVIIIESYNTIGGNWTLNDTMLAQILAERLNNPRITTWEQIVNPPSRFPPIDHDWNLRDMVGASELRTVLQQIQTELRNNGQGGLADHLNNHSNPHGTDKAQVGLGLVQNFPLANDTEAVDGLATDRYMTPYLTSRLVNLGVKAQLTAHTGNVENPHATTAAQVGAYSRIETDAMMNMKLDKTGVAADTAKVNGLTPLDFKAWVLAGDANNSMRLAGLTLEEIRLLIQGGASPNAEKFEGRTFLQATTEILSGTAAAATRFGGKTATEYMAYVLASKAADTGAFNGLSPADYKAWVLTGEAASAATFGGLDATNYRNQIVNSTVSDSTRFNGKTYLEAKTDILTGTAADSNRFGGKDPVLFKAEVLAGTAADSARLGGFTLSEILAKVQTDVGTNATSLAGVSAATVLTNIDNLTLKTEALNTDVVAALQAMAVAFNNLTAKLKT